MTGLYVHIPFCRQKCNYCDFASYAGKEALIDDYLGTLSKEAHNARTRAPFSTLYIGGGTPSLLTPEQLTRLFGLISKNIQPMSSFKEATFEVNPESLTAEKAAIIKASGMNRVSIGLQASQDRLLRTLGRPASFKEFMAAYRALRDAGFTNLNVDLMAGLPGQTIDDFIQTLDTAISLAPEHISFYAMEVHEGTAFFAEGVNEAPELSAEMYEKGTNLLEKAGFSRYEISNFSKPGMECLHNLNYWEQGDYAGIGLAAASHFDGERRTNTRELALYMNTAGGPSGPELVSSETLTPKQRKAEKIMLGLRKTAGIELPEDIFIEFKEEINRLNGKGLLEVQGKRIKIAGNAFYISNSVLIEFV